MRQFRPTETVTAPRLRGLDIQLTGNFHCRDQSKFTSKVHPAVRAGTATGAVEVDDVHVNARVSAAISDIDIDIIHSEVVLVDAA